MRANMQLATCLPLVLVHETGVSRDGVAILQTRYGGGTLNDSHTFSSTKAQNTRTVNRSCMQAQCTPPDPLAAPLLSTHQTVTHCSFCCFGLRGQNNLLRVLFGIQGLVDEFRSFAGATRVLLLLVPVFGEK